MSAPLYRNGQVIVELGGPWVVLFDPAQWILAYGAGAQRRGKPRYAHRSFCTLRHTLKRCIQDHCGTVEPAALRIIDSLSEVHPRVERLRRECRS